MSEQPNPGNVTTLDDYREGSRFDTHTHVDLHKYVAVPKYNREAIDKVHELEAARVAREAAIAAEQNAKVNELDPRPAFQETANVIAMRNAAINGQIKVAV